MKAGEIWTPSTESIKTAKWLEWHMLRSKDPTFNDEEMEDMRSHNWSDVEILKIKDETIVYTYINHPDETHNHKRRHFIMFYKKAR